MGLLDSLGKLASVAKTVQSVTGGAKKTTSTSANSGLDLTSLISTAQTLLNGKVDLNSLITLFTAYFTSKGQANASGQASSISNQIASVVNLAKVAGMGDLVNKLQDSDSPDLAKTLQSAISLISKK